ncbi:MAG TPA: FapA family protein [Pantanalinema sp.]
METSKPKAPTVKVTLKQRGLEAWAKITPAEPVSYDVVRSALREQGVREGIDEAALAALCEAPENGETLVANGVPPTPGENARIDYLFLTEDAGFNPLVDQFDRADYREVALIQNVVPGQLLARKTPPTAGVAGRAVTGEPIPAAPGKDVHILAGKNVELSANKLEAYATVTGIPKVAKNRLNVLPIFQVNDVDFSTGNINFQGSVQIRGSVNPGFAVKATEDVTIDGNVEQATIESGGTIRVRGGVRSAAHLQAQEDVEVRFCDSESILEAQRGILVKGDSLHCTLKAGLRIVVENRLIGGTARAGEYIQASIAGTRAETPTTVELVQVGSQEELEQLNETIAEVEQKLSQVSGRIQALMRDPKAGGPADLQRLTPVKITLNLQLAQLKTRHKQMTQRESGLEQPRFVVKSELFPGVTVRFVTREGERAQRIVNKQFAATARFVEGEIEI